MINRHLIRVRKYAAREMLYNHSQHAVYGLSYVDSRGHFVEQIAETPKNIRYFYNDYSYSSYVNAVHQNYDEANVLAVHRQDYE